jgi:glycine/D-amino acid oxidase-like deaminating enzyme
MAEALAMVEITIRGAGIFGLSIAWECAKRGASVQVIDPFGPGAGSSGGLVGALAPHVPENWNAKKAFQFDSLILAEQFWSEVSREGGSSAGYARTGRLQPLPDEASVQRARERGANACDLWQAKASWEVIPSAELGEWAPLSQSGWIVRDTLSARLHPRMACTALANALQNRGVPVLREGVEQGKVVWATGIAGLEALTKEIGKAVGTGVKGQAALLRLNRADLPQLFADTVHIVPHENGTVAIGSTSERDYSDPTSTDRQLDDVIARAVAAVPALRNAEVIERWAGVRPRSKSRAPMLGQWPGRSGHFIANGGFKIGFGMAPKIAQVMADLLLEERDAIPDDFRVSASL